MMWRGMVFRRGKAGGWIGRWSIAPAGALSCRISLASHLEHLLDRWRFPYIPAKSCYHLASTCHLQHHLI